MSARAAFARRTGRLASGALLLVLAALAALLLVPTAVGLQRYVIVSGSMTGTYDRGSVVFDEVIPTRSLHVGDVITYRPPPRAHVDHLITHRIVAIHRGPKGERVFRTRGDANRARDPWRFVLHGPTQARVRWSLPWVGYGLAALKVRSVRILLLGVPAILIALTSLVRLWRRLGEEAAAAAEPVRAPA
jgi:signal peptidase